MIVTKPFLHMIWLSAFWELRLTKVNICSMLLNTKPEQLPFKIYRVSFKEHSGVLGSAFFCVPGMFGSLEVKVLYPS
jgi:hypothetical protein